MMDLLHLGSSPDSRLWQSPDSENLVLRNFQGKFRTARVPRKYTTACFARKAGGGGGGGGGGSGQIESSHMTE